MGTAQLVIQCQSGDSMAFGHLYNRFASPMMRVIETYIPNRDVAQDILHDGFIIAFTALPSLKKVDRFEAWLTTIMRNLSLQYLRESATHRTVPLSETSGESVSDNDVENLCLSWDELNEIIDRLPDGYGKVFRFAVLDGLSHKEIGKLLGIAPHSSSSQLSHAKAMLRRLIAEYRVGISVVCVLTVVLTTILLRMEIESGNESVGTGMIAKYPEKNERTGKTRLPAEKPVAKNDAVSSPVKLGNKMETPAGEGAIKAMCPPHDSVFVASEDIEKGDTTTNIPKIPVVENKELLANNSSDQQPTKDKNEGWSLALAYNGNWGRNADNRYRIPIGSQPDLPSGDPEEIDVIEKNRHHIPVVVGISLSRNLSGRWSVESGIRYSYLRSEFLCESELERKETDQRIHYLGLPLKLNYRIVGTSRLGVYGQAGVALDISVGATQSVMKWEQGWSRPEFECTNISAPLQWSVEGGFGVQYQISPSFSIYAEPSLRYWLNSSSGTRTLRDDKPFEFVIPIGIRFDW